MKRILTLTAILAILMACVFPVSLMSQEGGQCSFQATEDIYLKIYDTDKDGVERGTAWSGHLSAGGQKGFNSPDGQVAYAVKKEKDDPWEEGQESCSGSEAIQVP